VLQNDTDYYSLFLCAIHTALRSGELVGLQWGDIDLHGKFLAVRRSVARRKLGSPKNGKTRRVDLSDSLLSTFSELRRKRKEEWLAKGQNEIPEWVFCNEDGGCAAPNNFKNRLFFRCLEKAGLRRNRFHDLRHTFASLLLQNGESLQYVKDQMGHSSVKVTVDVYGHLVPGANRKAVDRLPSLPTSERSQMAKEVQKNLP
jgi:integrase